MHKTLSLNNHLLFKFSNVFLINYNSFNLIIVIVRSNIIIKWLFVRLIDNGRYLSWWCRNSLSAERNQDYYV
jgi:hypothetical protein